MPPVLENHANISPERFASLANVLANQSSFKTALDWMLEQRPPLALTDTMAQDEFSYDALVALSDGIWLVYEVT